MGPSDRRPWTPSRAAHRRGLHAAPPRRPWLGRSPGGDNRDRCSTCAKPDGAVAPVAGTRARAARGSIRGRVSPLCLPRRLRERQREAEAAGALGGLAQRLVRDLGMPAVVAMTDKVNGRHRAGAGRLLPAAARARGAGPGPGRGHRRARRRGDVTVPALYSRLRPGCRSSATPYDRSLDLTRRRPDRGRSRPRCALLDRHERGNALGMPDEDGARPGFAALAEHAYDGCPRVLTPSARGRASGREALIAGAATSLRRRTPSCRCSVLRQRQVVGGALAGLVPGSSRRGRRRPRDAGPSSAWPATRARLRPGRPLARLEAPWRGWPTPRGWWSSTSSRRCSPSADDEDQRVAFFDRLLGLTAERRVVLTMRADFWGECAPYSALADGDGGPPGADRADGRGRVAAAMERQAGAVGLRFEADLAATILDEVRGEPGAMPLLQHALLELWKRRHGRWFWRTSTGRSAGVQGRSPRRRRRSTALTEADQERCATSSCG